MTLRTSLVLAGSLLISVTVGAPAMAGPSVSLATAQQAAPLSGKVGKLVKAINGNLDQFEKLIATPGSDKKATWAKASELLDSAQHDHKSISDLYSSRFSATHPEWVAVSARLTKAKTDGAAFEASLSSDKKDVPKQDVKTPAGGTVKAVKLPGGVAYELKKAVEHLDDFDRNLARGGKNKRGTWKAGKSELEEATYLFAKGERDYASKFDPAHPDWSAAKARLKTAEATLAAFYSTQVEGGGTSADGTKKGGYDDSQSVIAADNPNKRSVDRAIWIILMETERVRKLHAAEAMTSNLPPVADKSVAKAKMLHERLLGSYGRIINRESDQYKALCSEIETSERLAEEMPALVAAYTKAVEKREAAEALAQAEAKRLSVAEYEVALAKRLKAEIEAARFPKRQLNNKKFDKLVSETVTKHYSNQTLLRAQATGDFAVRQEARIVGQVIEYGTYRYQRAEVAMLKKNGQVWVYSLRLRNTLQPDGSWGPQKVCGSFRAQYQMLRANL